MMKDRALLFLSISCFVVETTALANLQAHDTINFRELFLNDVPLMDVRAPMEFEKGAFPTAVNCPLMTDGERHEVGLRYKEQGQDAAIDLGYELVRGELKAARLQRWIDFCLSCKSNNEQRYLYCFRGGLRSKIVQQWIKEETGVRVPMVTGGYKAMRTFLMEELDRSMDRNSQSLEWIVVCGKTGTGKTRILHDLKNQSVDLEGLAHHRGSTFGYLPENPGQPSQISFENSISISLLKALASQEGLNQQPRIFVEDEGNRIGCLILPEKLRCRMKHCDGIVVVEENLEKRIDILMEDYIVDLRKRFVNVNGGDEALGADLHKKFCLDSLRRVENRLGGVNHKRVKNIMKAAFREDHVHGDLSMHRVWINSLLVDYYDKSYNFHLEQRQSKVLFKGDRVAVMEWANKMKGDLSHT